MGTLSAPEFKDLLKPLLEARVDLLALTPVPTIYTAWPTIDYSVTDAIIIGYDARAPREAAAIGQGRIDEEVVLDSQVRVMRAGAGEAKVKVARDRAKLLVEAVDNELRTNHPELAGAGDQTLWSRVGSYEFAEFPDPGGGEPTVPLRICAVEFEIVYRARIAV